MTINLPFLLRLDHRIPDQNTAKRLELPHELPPCWILLPTMHFEPTGIEGCDGLWVGKLLERLAQMVVFILAQEKFTGKFQIRQVKESFTHNPSFSLQAQHN